VKKEANEEVTGHSQLTMQVVEHVRSLIAKGEQLFEKGVPERNIVACATCHGKNAEGAGIFPRLAGQHAEYIERQLHVIQDHLRKSPVMHGIIKDLKPDEMNALASFVQSK